MKRIFVFCIALLLLLGCGGKEVTPPQVQLDARAEATAAPAVAIAPTDEPVVEPAATAESAPTQTPAEPAAVSETASLAGALTAAWEQAGLLKDLYAIDAEDVLDLYGIDFALCKSGAAFRDAAGGYANEVVMLEAESAVLDEAEALLRDHLTAVKEQFRSYDAAALALAEKAVLVREGDAILFAISPQAQELLAAFRGLTK